MSHQDGPSVPAVPGWLFPLLAASCGIIVANLYYAQPLVGPISAALGLSPSAAGLIVTLTQVGYGLGLLLIVPAGDLIENRRLIVLSLILCVLALLALGAAHAPAQFLAAAFCVGLGSVAVQILVPYAAHLAPEAERGRIVGNVMSGLLLGIMLARPVSSFIASHFGWRMVFLLSTAVTGGLGLVLGRALPKREPHGAARYPALIASMGRLLLETPILQRRAAYQACQFCAFSLFWTVMPLELASPRFGLGQQGIALFALAGVAGAIAAPVSGRFADRGWGRAATLIGFGAVLAGFLLSRVSGTGSAVLGLLVAAAIMIDFGVTMSLVVSQRAIYSLAPAIRSRLNGLFMAIFFAGGAIGSALGGWAYARDGWHLASLIGVALPLLALALFATERRQAA